MSTPPTWLITGTSSGLGLSLSQLVLRKGHNLISISRHPKPDASLIALAGSYNPSPSPDNTSNNSATTTASTLHHISLDLSNPHQTHLKSTIQHFLKTHPLLTPTILINNAAVTTFSPLEHTSPDTLSHIMTTNFFSPLYLVQAVLPYMRRGTSHTTSSTSSTATTDEGREKVIVNISSTQGLCVDPAESGYDASKHALEAVSGVLAAEVGGFGIRVMVVNLGSLRTGFARGGERSGLGKEQSQRQQQGQNEDGEEKEDNHASSPDPYADPDHPVSRRIAGVNKLADVPGLARGDPGKTAAVLFDGIMRTEGSVVDGVLEAQRQRTLSDAAGSGIGRIERLVLGSDAQPKIERSVDRLKFDVEGCRVVSGLVEADK